MAFVINKSIIFVIALFSLLLLSVEATSRRIILQAPVPSSSRSPEKVDPALERLCHNAEFPGECESAATPDMSGNVNSHSTLQAGLKLIAERSQKGIEQAEKLKAESKSKETTEHLDLCIQKYQAIGDSTKKATEALPAHEFNKLESELAVMVADISECEDSFGGKSPLEEINTSLRKAAKNNLNIGTFVATPDKD